MQLTFIINSLFSPSLAAPLPSGCSCRALDAAADVTAFPSI